jgi:hypothetical protein
MAGIEIKVSKTLINNTNNNIFFIVNPFYDKFFPTIIDNCFL